MAVKERIDIILPDALLAENPAKRDRLARTEAFQPTDRAPVLVDTQIWYLLGARGVSFAEFIASPREHLRHHILNYKWRAEHIRDDLPVETEKLTFSPDFGALRGTEFPIQVDWQPDQPAKSRHLLTEPEQIDTLAMPDPAGGLNAMKIAFYHGMRAALADFDVRLNGQPLHVDVTLFAPGGPIPSAFALCGPNLFLWMKTDPERIHRLLALVTESHLNSIACFDALTGADPNHPIWAGADAADMLSPRSFREFVMPYYNQMWARYPGQRVFHMCGQIKHLLEIIRDELHVDRLDGFGFPVPVERLAEAWAGRLVMRGGPHPMLIHDGPSDAITAACEGYLRAAGRLGGYILAEGFGLMPGTPPEHIDAMVRAAERVGPRPEFSERSSHEPDFCQPQAF